MQQSFCKVESAIGGEYKDLLLTTLDSATDSISVMMFDWRWYPHDFSSPASLVNQSFVRAVRRNVDVRAIVNYQKIVPQLEAVGIKARAFESAKLLHAKFIIVDNKELLLGSHNLTENALSENIEVSLKLNDTDTITRLNSYFNSLWVQ